MRQESLADNSFDKFRKQTRKEQFLTEMENIIPWQELTELRVSSRLSTPQTVG